MASLQEAALARLRAVWNTGQVHNLGEVPASPLTPYAVVSVTPPRYVNTNLAGQAGTRVHRVNVQIVGDDVDEIGFALPRVTDAFVEHRLAVDGFKVSPPILDDVPAATPVRDPDAGGSLSLTLSYPVSVHPVT